MVSVLVALPNFAQAQTPAAPPGPTTPGAVVRVTHVRIKPGRTDQYWTDVRTNLKPIWDAQKAAGIISDYTVSTKSTSEGPSDWTVSIQVVYPNWAALDNLAARTAPITLAHYGTAEKRTAAANARIENQETTEAFFVRRQTINPMR
jgi:hypothetical protein